MTELKALEKPRYITSTALPSSSHFVINSSVTRRLGRVELRGKEPCCRDVNNEIETNGPASSLKIASSTLQTTNPRLMGLNRFGSAVRGVFATGVTMAWRHSSEIWEV